MKWKEQHELKALLIYKKIKEELDKDKIFTHNRFDTVLKKLANIRYLDTNGKEGLSGYSTQIKEIWEKHKDTPIKKLEDIIKKKG